MTFSLIQFSEDFPRDVGQFPNFLPNINGKGDYSWIKKIVLACILYPIIQLSKYDSLTKSKSLSW